MKAAVVQVAAKTSTGTQDYTDTSVTSDAVAAIFFATGATANDTTVAAARLLMGATDLTNNVHSTMATMADGSAGASCQMYPSNTGSLMQTSSSASVSAKAGYSSTLSNGVRMNFTTASSAFLENCLLLSGSDIEVKTSTATFNTTDTAKTVTHNLSGTPDIIIIQCSHGSSAFDAGGGVNTTIGVWERGGSTTAGLGVRAVHAANPTDVSAQISTDMGHATGAAGADSYVMSVSSVGATTFSLNRSFSGSTNMEVVIISMRGTSSALVAKCGVYSTPTSTGNTAAVSGMSTAPSVLFLFSTRLTASGSVVVDDSAGSYGLAWSANNSGTTNQMAAAVTMKDNVATSVAKCYTSASKALVILDNTGAANVLATVNSWDSGGVTLNYSAVNASALKVGYLALGLPASSGGSVRGGTLGGFSELNGGFRG